MATYNCEKWQQITTKNMHKQERKMTTNNYEKWRRTTAKTGNE